jgi:hypothetical protein
MDNVSEAATELTRARHAQGMAAYSQEGLRIAREIGNRGPVRFDAAGRLHPDILAAYWKHGFYIFEGVVGPEEIDELRRDAAAMLERAPVGPGAKVDERPPGSCRCPRELYTMIAAPTHRGTEIYGGRHPSKMAEPAR